MKTLIVWNLRFSFSFTVQGPGALDKFKDLHVTLAWRFDTPFA